MKKHFSRSSKHILGLFVFIFVLSSALGVAYGQASRLDRDNPQIRAAIEVKNRHTARVMGIPGVVGMGTGIGPDGRPVIKVFTTRAGIPEIPRSLDGLPVEVKVTGVFVAFADPTTRFHRPVPIGVSTGHPDITAGTIGCRVTGDLNGDGTPDVYALSNNHVYANQNKAYIGDSALQPGRSDGGEDPVDKIGELYFFVPIDFSVFGSNTMDAAIALSSETELGCSTPSDDGYGTPSSETVPASLGLVVQKYGRTTGLTYGEVSAIDVTAAVCYARCNNPFRAKYAWFDDQIAIISSSTDAFSLAGDSGSLIVTYDDYKNPVGLLFAGSSTHTLANRIELVLDRFDVTIDDTCMSSNNPPTADFSFTIFELTVDFTDQSTDSGGSIVAWDWDFGDGKTSTEQNPIHTYTTAGPYRVELTVTDNEGFTDAVYKDLTVSEGSVGFTLTATGYKVKGRQKADLEWTGANSGSIDILRDGVHIATTENHGFYTDDINQRGRGSYTYQVCEQGTTSTCSNEATVEF